MMSRRAWSCSGCRSLKRSALAASSVAATNPKLAEPPRRLTSVNERHWGHGIEIEPPTDAAEAEEKEEEEAAAAEEEAAAAARRFRAVLLDAADLELALSFCFCACRCACCALMTLESCALAISLMCLRCSGQTLSRKISEAWRSVGGAVLMENKAPFCRPQGTW